MSSTSWVCAQEQSKVDHFRHSLGLLATSEEELPQLPKVWNRLFGAFDLLEDSLRGWGLVREDLGFLGQAGVSRMFQVNIVMPIFSLENGQTPSDQALKKTVLQHCLSSCRE